MRGEKFINSLFDLRRQEEQASKEAEFSLRFVPDTLG
jgi:hypothetical protein